MSEKKAIYYGQVKLIPGIVCDGYVLDDPDSTTVLSERGTADLLDMDHKTLQAMGGNWPPKTLESFCDKNLIMGGNYVEVVARNSPYCGRKIEVYTTKIIQSLIHAYSLAFMNDGLRKNQIHIGKRAVELAISLVRTALDAAIKEACGVKPEIQKTAKKNYVDAVAAVQEWGLRCSVKNNIATKQDILEF
ncbi:MAG: hypothetical protein HUU50_20265, partial [Candidatus Brocadiae bacterium]|nr:hypothetical protein [Candidatus Brocadiia bacterium]